MGEGRDELKQQLADVLRLQLAAYGHSDETIMNIAGLILSRFHVKPRDWKRIRRKATQAPARRKASKEQR
jgi:hypothetical protein